MTQGFADMIEAINRVAKALGADIPEAIKKIPTDVNINVNQKFTKSGDTGFRDTDYETPEASYDVGAMIRRDHVARVHAGEIIGPVDFMSRALAGALERNGSAAQQTEQPVNLYLDGNLVAQVVLRRTSRVLATYGVG
jgi:hypothetical protein